MAGGANKKFMDEPQTFIQNNIIDVKVIGGDLLKVAAAHKDPKKATLAQTGRIGNLDVADNSQAAGVYDFDLVKAAQMANLVVGSDERQVPVYELRQWGHAASHQKLSIDKATQTFTTQYKAGLLSHPIRAYWVPWSSGSCWSVQLGDAADYFFTPTMDGCSLAISSDADPVVTHGNYKSLTDPTKADEALTLQKIDQHHGALHSDRAKTLKKTDYTATDTMKLAGKNFLVTVVGLRVNKAWEFFYQRRKTTVLAKDEGSGVKVVLKDRLVRIA